GVNSPIAAERVSRSRAVISAADVVGYTRLMRADERGTLAQLKTLRKEVFKPQTAKHNGRIVKTTGDGVLVEFASAVDAVQYAIKVQRALARRNEDVPMDQRIDLRIGINLGDIRRRGRHLRRWPVQILEQEILAEQIPHLHTDDARSPRQPISDQCINHDKIVAVLARLAQPFETRGQIYLGRRQSSLYPRHDYPWSDHAELLTLLNVRLTKREKNHVDED
ncbi:MAG: adenylate/guanylate cyclase domain-containing protein, partial [Gemmatimonadales bacterium]